MLYMNLCADIAVENWYKMQYVQVTKYHFSMCKARSNTQIIQMINVAHDN